MNYYPKLDDLIIYRRFMKNKSLYMINYYENAGIFKLIIWIYWKFLDRTRVCSKILG